MKKNIAEFVYACLVCQKSRIEHQKPSGLMHSLFMPEWKWDGISMEFFEALPKTVLEQGYFTSHLLSFDNNKVLKIINWTC